MKIKLTYDQVLFDINSHLKFGIKPGLERILKLLNLIGNPQDNLDVIHVTGTNGKGSTSEMLASVFKNAGYKVGLYTSPQIVDFRDRIKINGKMISKNEVVRIYSEIKNVAKITGFKKLGLTEFEIITAMALKYFRDENCEIVILEAGLGGRLDATNVIKSPLASIIASISLDHTNILGNTIEKITYEKCGIIKEKSTVITSQNQQKCVLDIIRGSCIKKDADLIVSDFSNFSNLSFDINNGTSFCYNGQNVSTPLIGMHQIENISNVFSCINAVRKRFSVNFEDIKRGLKNLDIKSRTQVICKSPLILFDGAHNPGSVRALKKVVKNLIFDKKVIGLVGMFKDKDVKNSLSQILPIFDAVITMPLENNRTMSIEEITEISLNYNKNTIPAKDINQALGLLFSTLKKSPDVHAGVIFGSFSMAKYVLNYKNLLYIDRS